MSTRKHFSGRKTFSHKKDIFYDGKSDAFIICHGIKKPEFVSSDRIKEYIKSGYAFHILDNGKVCPWGTGCKRKRHAVDASKKAFEDGTYMAVMEGKFTKEHYHLRPYDREI